MEQIEYTRTVVPSSMRSPYWKYFGFPSDSGNNILTRQKIVCTICNTAIAYNKNTSNLRTHLMAKHVEIFQKIVMASNATVEDKPVTSCHQNFKEQQLASTKEFDPSCDDNVKFSNNKRQYNESQDKASDFLQSKKHFVGNFLTLPEYNNTANAATENNIIVENSSSISNKEVLVNSNYIGFIATNESNAIEVAEAIDEDLANTNHEENTKSENLFSYDPLNQVSQNEHQHLESMDIMLADMIQTDLLTLDLLEEQGFCNYNQQLTGVKIDKEVVKRILKVIETRFTNAQQMITSHVIHLSQIQPYSLSIEIYTDNDEEDILNVYFNYLSDDQTNLKSILFKSGIITSKSLNISELLMDINLQNCSGVVVPCLDKNLNCIIDFANCHELPLIECLESMLSRCLNKIFAESEFSEDYKLIFKLTQENTNTRYIKKPILRRCHWSLLNISENNFKNVEQTEVERLADMQNSYEYLKPLKMALDIIMDEYLPLCTLTRPLILKLFEEHFSAVNSKESTRINKIKNILQKELHERTLVQSFLNEATFFDTRFHRDFALQESVFDITNLKCQVIKRFKHILQITYTSKTSTIKTEQNSTDSFMSFRKCSNLKSFFKRDVSLTNTESTSDLKTNLDLEIEQYQNEDCLDLDQSPALWWQQQNDNYKQLSKVAKRYLTIPCCCLPRLCRLDVEERYLKLQRRKNLSHFCMIESKLWYLFYNNDVVTEII